ncbi:hypothetical protein DZC30_10535 [Comamonas testosteroni]|uniref:DUF5329 domain-containing protein n=1 Tax=Comamonas testosteroni TaxID=285 RepID=A0A373FLP4_COMTE|nr:DUF5329 domain-containing protein [Comamonas testosteroni]RGE45074.1 hypothetical protein DZC30_10535 [Comamonas testosteroni]
MKTLFAALLIAATPLAALAEKPTPAASREIEHLIAHLKASGCEFQRNGSWYDSAKAAEHLRGKYDYLLKKGWVATSEDFIARAATESSMSHKPYQVRCAGQQAQPSATWLQAELKQYRSSQ